MPDSTSLKKAMLSLTSPLGSLLAAELEIAESSHDLEHPESQCELAPGDDTTYLCMLSCFCTYVIASV